MLNSIHIPLFGTRATATVSVALVLVILGIAALVGVATGNLSKSVRDTMGFVVIFNDNVTAGEIAEVTDRLKSTGAVSSTVYSSPDEILSRWQKMVGEDENILNLAGVNPFTAELEVRVTDRYASADSIAMIAAPIVLLPQVYDIKAHNDLIDNVNSTLRSVSLTLVTIAAALLVVSFVLIFNTVRLAVYSRRFLINTMQLVGATKGFIRRPFMIENIVNGAVAGVAASAIVALTLYYCISLDGAILSILSWDSVIVILGGLVLAGIVICLIASAFACNKYLSMKYDDLYR